MRKPFGPTILRALLVVCTPPVAVASICVNSLKRFSAIPPGMCLCPQETPKLRIAGCFFSQAHKQTQMLVRELGSANQRRAQTSIVADARWAKIPTQHRFANCSLHTGYTVLYVGLGFLLISLHCSCQVYVSWHLYPHPLGGSRLWSVHRLCVWSVCGVMRPQVLVICESSHITSQGSTWDDQERTASSSLEVGYPFMLLLVPS